MSEAFNISGESSDITAGPPPQLQGLFIPGIDNSQFVDGFGIVTPWGGGSTARRYGDYGIPSEISRQSTQLNDLASSLIPAEGGGLAYGVQGDRGFQGPPGPQGLPGIIHIMGQNSNFLIELPHNIDQINALGTAANMLPYTDTYVTHWIGFVWTERQPAGAGGIDWVSVASDSDGSNLIVVVDGGRLYTSDDSGATWTERTPAGATNKNWQTVVSDSDGSHLAAAIHGGRLYTSADSGVNWTERRPIDDDDYYWYGLASDSDGSHLIVGEDKWNGKLFTSSNYGANWTERTPPLGTNDAYYHAAASDSDGSNLIIGTDERLYTSANGGADWTERQPAGDTDKIWLSVASDADGSHLMAAVNDGGLYTSDDSGATWTLRQPAGAGNHYWHGVASDSDGSHLIAGIQNGRVYISEDSGVTWVEAQPGGDLDGWWGAAASDSDGSHLMLAWGGFGSGKLYTGAAEDFYSEATWEETGFTSAGRALLDDADATTQATTLGLGTSDSPTFTGLTLSGLMQGSIVFAGASGVISQDNSNLFWDNVNKKFGVGTPTPNAPLEVKGAKPAGNVGGFQSGMLHVTGAGTAEFSNSVITGHSAYNTNTQLWYLGSLTVSNNDIGFINRQNAAIHFSTNNTSRMTIDAAGNVTLAIIAAEGSDVDKFLVDSTGVIKYRTGAQVLSDIGGQASDAGLTSLAALVYASDSFIKVTATDTYLIRTIAETKTDLSLNLVENTAHSTDAHTMTIDGRDVSVDGTKLDGIEALADVTATHETSHALVLVDGDFGSAGLMNTDGAGTYSIKAIGTDVQAFGAALDDLSALTPPASDGQFIVATGAGAFAYESGATARTSLGLGTGDSPTFTNLTLDATGTISFTGNLDLVGAGDSINFRNSVANQRTVFRVMPNGTVSTAAALEFFDTDFVADAVNYERLSIQTQHTYYEIFTNKGGTGTINPLIIYTSGNTNQLYLAADGGITMATLKSGTDQANAGAAADELYHDTDDNTIKIGV